MTKRAPTAEGQLQRRRSSRQRAWTVLHRGPTYVARRSVRSAAVLQAAIGALRPYGHRRRAAARGGRGPPRSGRAHAGGVSRVPCQCSPIGPVPPLQSSWPDDRGSSLPAARAIGRRGSAEPDTGEQQPDRGAHEHERDQEPVAVQRPGGALARASYPGDQQRQDKDKQAAGVRHGGGPGRVPARIAALPTFRPAPRLEPAATGFPARAAPA